MTFAKSSILNCILIEAKSKWRALHGEPIALFRIRASAAGEAWMPKTGSPKPSGENHRSSRADRFDRKTMHFSGDRAPEL